jgi:hypothetical protein
MTQRDGSDLREWQVLPELTDPNGMTYFVRWIAGEETAEAAVDDYLRHARLAPGWSIRQVYVGPNEGVRAYPVQRVKPPPEWERWDVRFPARS